jgi:hypothetical protein
MRTIRSVLKATGALLALIGLIGIPADIKAWHRLLSALDADLLRWIFLAVGLVLIAFGSIPRLRFWENRGHLEPEDTQPDGISIFTTRDLDTRFPTETEIENPTPETRFKTSHRIRKMDNLVFPLNI